jgi:hypothetical protein
MSIDNNIGYEFAGKGAKRRLRLAEIPKRIAKPKAYLQKPEFEKRKAKKIAVSEAYHTAIGVKARIRLLVIDRDAGYLDICEIMKREGCPVSGVTISHVRSDMIEVMKLLEKEGLLNTDALARRRKKIKSGESGVIESNTSARLRESDQGRSTRD